MPMQNTPTPRIRGRRWMDIKKVVLAQEPWCRSCASKGITTRSTQVDHIERLADGGINHPDNYQGLCADCHKVKTKVENGCVKQEVGVDGYAKL